VDQVLQHGKPWQRFPGLDLLRVQVLKDKKASLHFVWLADQNQAELMLSLRCLANMAAVGSVQFLDDHLQELLDEISKADVLSQTQQNILTALGGFLLNVAVLIANAELDVTENLSKFVIFLVNALLVHSGPHLIHPVLSALGSLFHPSVPSHLLAIEAAMVTDLSTILKERAESPDEGIAHLAGAVQKIVIAAKFNANS